MALNPADANSWLDFVTRFDASYKSFMDNYNGLVMMGPYINSKHPELIPEYDRLVNAGAANYNKLIELKATRDYAYSWLTWLQNGAQGVFQWFTDSVGLSGYDRGLGVIPVAIAIVGIGAATAALVVIAKWIADAYKFAQRLNALQELERQGKTPAEARATIDAAMGPPTSVIGDLLGIPFNTLIVGALLIFLGPPIISAITARRQ